MVALVFPVTVLAQQGPWQQLVDPVAAGWRKGPLLEARAAAERAGSAAVMVVHRGKVVIAWGDVTRRFKCHSVRKSVLSCLYGMAVARKLVDLETTLEALGIDDLQALSAVEKSASVRDLLAARSGIYHPAAKEPGDMKRGRPARHSKRPGEVFHYNNWDFNVLGTIFGKKAGLDVFAAFDKWLGRPLGLEDWRMQDGTWELEPGNSRYPAYAFRLSTRDLARFGMLFANRGKSNGVQVVPGRWIERSTARISSFGNGRGYGNMWWVYPAGSLGTHPELNKHDAFAAIGTGGQTVLVVPGQDFVFVHRGDTDNDRHVRGGDVWKLAEQLFAARVRERDGQPKVGPLKAEPLPGVTAAPVLPAEKPVTVAFLRSCLGDFEAQGLGRAKFFLHDDKLFARVSSGHEVQLFHEGDGAFFARPINLRIRFLPSDDGKLDRVDITLRGRTVRGTRAQ